MILRVADRSSLLVEFYLGIKGVAAVPIRKLQLSPTSLYLTHSSCVGGDYWFYRDCSYAIGVDSESSLVSVSLP